MGGPFRQPYGSAIGFANQFSFFHSPASSGTSGLLLFNDSTPDVTLGELFIANNTSLTTITYFDLQQYAYKAAEYSGKMIRILVVDNGSTQFANSGQLFLSGTDNLSTAGANTPALYEFVHFNSSWYQTGFKTNRAEMTLFATNVGSSLNVNGVRFAVLNNTGGTTNSIISFSGGQVAQELSFVLRGSNAVRIIGGGNIFMVGTNALLLDASGLYKAIKVDTMNWRLMAINSGASS